MKRKERAEDIPVGGSRTQLECARKSYSLWPYKVEASFDNVTIQYSPIRGGHRLWCGLQWSLIIFDLHTLVLD